MTDYTNNIRLITMPGPLHFGSIESLINNMDRNHSKIIILNMSHIPAIDEPVAEALVRYYNKMKNMDRHLIITRMQPMAKAVFTRLYGELVNDNYILFDEVDKARDYAFEVLNR